MRYDDWGVRSQQWAGLRSVSTSVCRVPVHYVRAEPVSAAAHEAPVHLLVPPMTGSASMWIDLVPHLRQFGPVISVDLPGTITGHTGAPYRRGPRADLDARFVSAFVRQLRLESQVVLHGWSMGGLVAALAAGTMPEKTRGVVLVAPALPWRRESPAEALGWQTLGRLAVAAGPADSLDNSRNRTSYLVGASSQSQQSILTPSACHHEASSPVPGHSTRTGATYARVESRSRGEASVPDEW